MDIRNYRESDQPGCLAVFDSSFSGAEQQRAEFAAFLGASDRAYFVMEHDGTIVGCGGFQASGAEANLRWGMVRRDMQRQGFGRYLLLYRLKAVGNLPGIQFVQAIVPSPVARFYEKNGLKMQREGEGLAEMRMKLQVCTA